MNLSLNEKTILKELNGHSIDQCLSNCNGLGSFTPAALGGVRITKGLIGGLEAKGLLIAKFYLDSPVRKACFKLSDLGVQATKKVTPNG